MDARTRFHQLLKRDFAPLLRSEGFKGSGTTFRRRQEHRIDVINIQGSHHGGECCVNFGVHYSFLPLLGGVQADPKKLNEYACAFRDRLHEASESDHWWSYGRNDAEAEASIASLIDLFKRRGTSFFQRFEPFPDVFEKVTPEQLAARDLTNLPVRMGLIHTLLTMARIMIYLGRHDLCREFADIGLRHVGHSADARLELERLRDGAQALCSTEN